MSILTNSRFQYFLLILVLVLALILRVYKLDKMPPSLNWDETAAAYNAFSIANYGQDEYGKYFPLSFTSFGDDKQPVQIYTTAIFIKIFGTNDFTVRLPNAIFGVLSVLLVFLLVQIWFKKFYLSLLASLFLTISPFHIHFSRGLWEMVYALFYFILGLYGFHKGIQSKNWWLFLGYVSFGLSLLSYHSAKVVTLLMVVIITLLYLKDLIRLKKLFIISFSAFMFFIILIAFNPGLSGSARIQQTKFSQDKIDSTQLFKLTKNSQLGFGEVVWENYKKHFTIDYLFITGDQTPRDSVKTYGMFHKIDAIFLIIGLISLLFLRSRISLIIILWALIAPLPSSLTTEAPVAHRAIFMMGSMHIISAIGAYKIITLIKKANYQLLVSLALLIILGFSLKTYLNEYYGKYNNEAIQWQYGMKQIVEYVSKHPEYSRVYMTDVRSQPYIFFLYYLKISPLQLQKTVIYNSDIRNRSYNLIYSFNRYQFGGWDEIQSMPDPNLLYIIEEGKYGGLAHKNDFKFVTPIKFPNGDVAFYIVSAN